MSKIISRPYTALDLAACLAIFEGNVPTFFAPDERADFQKHLKNIDVATAPYIVLERGGTVVACGGLTIDKTRKKASLSWGMVDRSLHGQRLGTKLTQARLTLARSVPGLEEIELSTSQHTHGFYEAFGFAVSGIVPCGFGPELDRWDMSLRL
ncbi:GNAT family N-acetyltransferase [Sinirhodobacter populi]|uniref:GNAT family N-acetyltransferase n=1 Tax=Paenirhodobacter populi TaxID=2306993 RepID=A0A443JZK8_9RHOB|nr:GNAT family N-acetyltransferase [Sinirhodobacter populi]RWR09175.1 GNAT family N-acetyltransferase [Sinirhodobacter populi]RWR24688.1 GNAT family N-acetyltransferase [Sinirhodobacter populi]RWR25901.1 GNAT family N-acetyltransferase [Sinirhodobacter populi]